MKSAKTNWKYFIMFVMCTGVLTLLDQFTKIAAVNRLKGQDPFVIINGVFEFYYLENTGTAWGMFEGGRYIFLVLTVVILALLCFFVLKMPLTKKYIPIHIVLILVASGALGNFIDRLVLGYVRDFIYFKLIDFPIFNVADTYVTISIFALIVMILFVYEEEDFYFIRFGKKKKVEDLENSEDLKN